jgi:hypothetical protein
MKNPDLFFNAIVHNIQVEILPHSQQSVLRNIKILKAGIISGRGS